MQPFINLQRIEFLTLMFPNHNFTKILFVNATYSLVVFSETCNSNTKGLSDHCINIWKGT